MDVLRCLLETLLESSQTAGALPRLVGQAVQLHLELLDLRHMFMPHFRARVGCLQGEWNGWRRTDSLHAPRQPAWLVSYSSRQWSAAAGKSSRDLKGASC